MESWVAQVKLAAPAFSKDVSEFFRFPSKGIDAKIFDMAE
jgi:hypothetical protein